MFLRYFVQYYGHLIGVKMQSQMRCDLFDHLQKLPYRFYDNNETGKIMSRMTNDLMEVSELAHHGPENLIISSISIIASFIYLSTIDIWLTLIIFAAVPFLVLIAAVLRKKMRDAFTRSRQSVAQINASLESSISGIRVAKAFGNEQKEIEKFTGCTDQYVDARRGYYKVMASFFSGTELFMNLMSLSIICAGSYLIMKEQMDVATLVTFNMYVASVQSPIRKLTQFTEQFTQGMAGFQRFRAIMHEKPDIVDSPDAKPLADVKGEVEFKHVTFTYDKEKEVVLEDVNLHIRPGEMLALVGPSGGGKTTLCQLIPRFYEVSAGSIKLDGHDVRDVTQRSIHQNIGIVQQDVFLFADTILENIRYGKPGASMEEVIEAAKKAEIYEDILAMPEGFNTYVGERGTLLSGGQKQRVSIARIFLKNPPILILDEATSALDSVTESKIQKAFDTLAQGRTTLIIAHRLSTIRAAERIVSIADGVITEVGSHEELMAKGGMYAQLYATQTNIG